MTSIDKISTLYDLSKNENFGFSTEEINAVEKEMGINLPMELKNYLLTLGKNKEINFSHNRLLEPNEIRFSKDKFLVFYEENQDVVHWGIKEQDLQQNNPPVWGNYGTVDHPDWHMESNSLDTFILLMAVYNGTFGGLKYCANSFRQIDKGTMQFIEGNWIKVPELSWEKQKIYTDNFHEMLSLSFDDQNNCNAVFVGTNNQLRFENILDRLDIDWSYTSYDDEEDDESVN